MQLSPISPTKEIDVCTQADLVFTLVDSQMQTWGRVLSSKNDWVTILYPLGVLRRSCTIKVPLILGPVKVSSCVEVKWLPRAVYQHMDEYVNMLQTKHAIR